MPKDLNKELEKLEKEQGKDKFEIDTEHQLIKKKGYKVISSDELDSVGFDTVAQKLADTEGTTLKKAQDKLNKAKEEVLIG